jgi:uncharacterized lipoprotein YbaY/membrane-bound inhibitor of C-type lysozyme
MPLQRMAAFALCCLAGTWAAANSPSVQVIHRCSRQVQVVVLYDNSAREPGRAVAWVHANTQTHRLPLVRSASGARYTDGLWSWWGKGGEARLERKGRPAITGCRVELTQRVLIDRRTRTQWLLPQAWTEERVNEAVLQGAAAQAGQPGAQLLARYSTRPSAGSSEPKLLAQLMVFETSAWDALAQHQAAGVPADEVVLRTPTWSYVLRLPESPSSMPAAPDAGASAPEPQPPGSQPQQQQAPDELQAAAQALRSGLQLWGRGPLLENCQVRGSVSYRERMALLPDDELQLQLLDASQPDQPPKVLAEHKRAAGRAQVPLRFELACGEARATFDEDARLVVTARIVRGSQVLFASEEPVPVLTQGHGREVELLLARKRDKPPRPSRETSR